MKELNVEIIYAKSPQAKGRVERFNRTLQDEFLKEFNERFAVSSSQADVHRDVKGIKLHEIFCYKKVRQLRNDYTINLNGGYVQLLKGSAPLPRPKQNVT